MCPLFKNLENSILLKINIYCSFSSPPNTLFPRQRKGKGAERRGGDGRRGLPCLEALSSLDFTKAVTSTTGLSATADQTGETV